MWLLDLTDGEYREALHYDLMQIGWSVWDIESQALSWFDLKCFVRFLPMDSALMRSLHGDDSYWGLKEQLLAAAVDTLRVANWQRGEGKGDEPEPIERPGVESKNQKMDGMDEAEALDWLGWTLEDIGG